MTVENCDPAEIPCSICVVNGARLRQTVRISAAGYTDTLTERLLCEECEGRLAEGHRIPVHL